MTDFAIPVGPRLGVNIDHVATIRQARGTRYPDPLEAAFMAVNAGADGLTIHLREDRRHIQERDVLLLQQCLSIPMNLEMAATESMVAFAEAHHPAHCCLVPERREELTTEGGLDVAGRRDQMREVCARLADAGIRVSLFIDPDDVQIEAAVEVGAPVVEFHTGSYAAVSDDACQARELAIIARAIATAEEASLIVHAGHGLHYQNVQPVAALAGIEELNIGHAIVARAIFTGLAGAVGEMKQLLRDARR